MCQATNSGRNTERNGHFEENLLRDLSVLKVIVARTASAWFGRSEMERMPRKADFRRSHAHGLTY